MSEGNKADLANRQKWNAVLVRINAYYIAIAEAADLVDKGQAKKLEEEIVTKEKQCRQEANEVACWAAKGLKQIESCHKSKERFEEYARKVDKLQASKDDKEYFHTTFTLGAAEVESVCKGYVVSAMDYVQMFKKLGLLDKQQTKPNN